MIFALVIIVYVASAARIAVEGVTGTFEVHESIICSGLASHGACPGPQPGLLFGACCHRLQPTTNVFGCVARTTNDITCDQGPSTPPTSTLYQSATSKVFATPTTAPGTTTAAATTLSPIGPIDGTIATGVISTPKSTLPSTTSNLPTTLYVFSTPMMSLATTMGTTVPTTTTDDIDRAPTAVAVPTPTTETNIPSTNLPTRLRSDMSTTTTMPPASSSQEIGRPMTISKILTIVFVVSIVVAAIAWVSIKVFRYAQARGAYRARIAAILPEYAWIAEARIEYEKECANRWPKVDEAKADEAPWRAIQTPPSMTTMTATCDDCDVSAVHAALFHAGDGMLLCEPCCDKQDAAACAA
ncbi:Aste57867_20839 [Aphanomyces stellatus]|uniref:Aste57867_20839 protein n=1 Tax=Aphanomyces stellatus TaxID=120398 RepID=A0A485LFX9_9STRA|nr:hypothetical protein As57867_020771 [Aphanomyces stellatus]VFT97517.1 Aste57867_20839 [Aphanomyces stellatus]